MRGVQVGMTDPGGGDLDQNLATPRSRYRDLLDHQRCTEFTYHGGFHAVIHDVLLIH